MTRLHTRIATLRARLDTPLARDAIIGASLQGIRLLILALAVFLLARALSATGLGAFVGVAALATILATLSGLGAGQVLIRGASLDESQHASIHAWARIRWMLSFALLLPAFLALARAAVPEASWKLLLLIGFAELGCQPFVTLSAQSLQALDRSVLAQCLFLQSAALRLMAVAGFMLVQASTAVDDYAVWHCAAAAVSMLLTLCVLPRRHTSRPGPAAAHDNSGGIVIALSNLSSSAVSELDKTLALRYAGAAAAGQYAAGYRISGSLTAPIVALTLAAQPRLYQALHIRDIDPRRLIRKLFLAALLYGLAAIAIAWMVAPPIARLLGPSYVAVADLAGGFGILALLLSLRTVSGAVLICAERQRFKLVVETCAAIALVFLAGQVFVHAPPARILAWAIAVEATLGGMLLGGVYYLVVARHDRPLASSPR